MMLVGVVNVNVRESIRVTGVKMLMQVYMYLFKVNSDRLT